MALNQPQLAAPRAAHRLSSRAGFLALVGLWVAAAAAKPVLFGTLDPDCFWHLRVAEQLQREGIGPLRDHFSFASNPAPWTAYSWLAELGMKTVWNLGGYRAALATEALITSLIVALIALASLGASRVDGRPRYLASAIATAFGTFLTLPYLSFRPATAAVALLGFAAWLLWRDQHMQRSRMVWLLPLVTALLANVHLYALVMPLWLAALLAGAVWDRFHCEPDQARETRRRMVRLAVLLALVSAACLATPMLHGGLSVALRYQWADPMVRSPIITEMQPFTRGPMGKIAGALVIGFGLLVICRCRQLTAGQWIWLALSAALLARLGRFAPLFALVAAPLAAATLPQFSDELLRRRTVLACAMVAIAVVLGRMIFGFPSSQLPMERWLNRHGPETPSYPVEAAEFVSAHVQPRTGRLVNEFTWGGYLIWKLGDRWQVLLDGRTQLYSDAFWRVTYLGTIEETEQYLQTLSADAAILPLQGSRFCEPLKELGWTIAFADAYAMVLLPPR